MLQQARTIGMRRVRRSARRLRRAFRSRALILMYHRVVDLPSDPQLLCVTPEHFAAQMEILRRDYQPLSLLELAKALREGTLPNRSVAITFDDGYVDNLENAAPVLGRHDLPATVFVTSGALGRREEFWWDELDRLLLQPGLLPDPLELRIGGSVYRWETGSAATYTADDARLHRDWHVERPVDPGPRQRLYRAVYDVLQPLPAESRGCALDQLRALAGVDAAGRATHRTMTAAELVRLSQDELIEVGAHTVTHPLLAALPVEAQRSEIEQSKACLEEILGRPVVTFSYPHGSLSAETVARTRAAGFACAGTSDPDAVWTDADPYQLPRVVVRDWDGDAFARQMKEWMRG
ncbi:MAG TPA: polysaccharide deacetylase family protein [Nitrolancea sp.]|nr:polysaccharide deacetylase family protein [Nitrolancea sp.]